MAKKNRKTEDEVVETPVSDVADGAEGGESDAPAETEGGVVELTDKPARVVSKSKVLYNGVVYPSSAAALKAAGDADYAKHDGALRSQLRKAENGTVTKTINDVEAVFSLASADAEVTGDGVGRKASEATEDEVVEVEDEQV